MRPRIFLLGAILAIVLLASCATTPTKTAIAPQWVTATPAATSEYTYFVGSGSDSSADLAAANENAAHSLVADVARYVGVTISSETSAPTRAGLQSFENEVAESIQESSSATGSDFSVVDRWVRRDGEQITVFLLGRYRTTALEAEKSRLLALQSERTGAVVVSEQQGDALLQAGRPYLAVQEYLEAALAASGSKADNGSIKFERTMKKAIAAIATIRLSVVTDNLKGMAGEPLAHSFLAEVRTQSGGVPAKLIGVPFRVSYPVGRNDGKTALETMLVASNSDGNLEVAIPAPQLIGRQSVTATLDLQLELTPLLRLKRPAQKALVALLEEKIGEVHVVFHYSTASRAASVPTGVLVQDLDRGGNAIPQDDAAVGIVGALTRAGFDILPIPSNRSLQGIDLPDLVKILRNNFGDKIKRAVVGTAKISGFEYTEGNYTVKVSGTVEVADLESGRVLFSTSQVKLSRASDASSAITAAFKDLGTSIGNEIRDNLR